MTLPDPPLPGLDLREWSPTGKASLRIVVEIDEEARLCRFTLDRIGGTDPAGAARAAYALAQRQARATPPRDGPSPNKRR